jgi:isoleucyl-tRNA synthetase
VGRADPGLLLQGCGEVLLRPELLRHVASIFDGESADAWYGRDAKDLLPAGFACPKCGGKDFDKERDILDVWFDSGSSHAAVLGHRPDMPWPCDVYLEGSDQHRGWFHSSLLIGVGTRGRAPYNQVITHGFTVDAEGKKISKSLGNDVDTQKLIAQYGAEILRLWTIMIDYREDMRISDDMIRRVAEAYRKVRNTIRYLLSNLSDFDPAKDAVADAALDELDAYMLARHRQVVARVLDAYEACEYHTIYQQLGAVHGGRPLLLLPGRAEGPASTATRRTRRGAARPRRALADRPRPAAAARAGAAVHERRGLGGAAGPAGRLGPPRHLPRARGRRHGADRALGDAARRARRGDEGARGGARGQADRGEPRGGRRGARPRRDDEGAAGARRALEVFPGNLANLFIVSEVRLEDAEGPLEVRVEHAAGRKVRALLDLVGARRDVAGPPRRVRALQRGPRPPVKRALPYALLIAFVVILDQITKAIVVRSIGLHDYVPLVDGLLSLSHVRNHGAAFGLLSDWNLPYQSLILSTLSLIALVAIAAYFVHLPARARLPRLALALVLAARSAT